MSVTQVEEEQRRWSGHGSQHQGSCMQKELPKKEENPPRTEATDIVIEARPDQKQYDDLQHHDRIVTLTLLAHNLRHDNALL
jgi:hypothetical protein